MGIIRLDDSLADLVRAGKISLDEGRIHAEAPDELAFKAVTGAASSAAPEGPVKLVAEIDASSTSCSTSTAAICTSRSATRRSRAPGASSRRCATRSYRCAEMEELLFEILNPSRRGRSRRARPRLRLRPPRARFRANYLYRFDRARRGLPLHSAQGPDARRFRMPGSDARARRKAGRARARHGPTGSGKSTTLAAMITTSMPTGPCHILTIEDPVEFVQTPLRAQVTHREVGPDARASPVRSAALPARIRR